ncbi:MAG: GNAT family N-acetyltransferase [Pseudomonadota bacterium]
MDVEILDYDSERDFEAVKRIWYEVGWLEEEDAEPGLQAMLKAGTCAVLPIHGEAECSVIGVPGRMQYLDADLNLGVIAAVTTSRIARRMGAAQSLTVDVLGQQASAGAQVAALGMFDQGFYNRVGFGTGPYVISHSFDPATLRVDVPQRPPVRLGKQDAAAMHAALAGRKRGHGGCVLEPVETVEAETYFTESSFGFGFCDGPDGALSHFIWGDAEDVEHGPYSIDAIAYRNTDELFELLGLIRSLGDQVNAVHMNEPEELQLQDLLATPFRNQRSTLGSTHTQWQEALATWQARILDLPGCIERVRHAGEPLRFALSLDDPASQWLRRDHGWRGIGGDYIVSLGESSTVETGSDAALLKLTASAGAFSRWWLGVGPASRLALSDDLSAPPELLEQLDGVAIPKPFFGWDF